jgi:hypothetical protein
MNEMGTLSTCPDLTGSPDPSDPTHIVETYYFWTEDCPIPLRQGVGNIPGLKGDFGLAHIEARYNEGAINHETTTAAKTIWAKALGGSAAVLLGTEYYCNSWLYTDTIGVQETMQVYADLKPFGPYPFKGIITAYSVVGNQPCKTSNTSPD